MKSDRHCRVVASLRPASPSAHARTAVRRLGLTRSTKDLIRDAEFVDAIVVIPVSMVSAFDWLTPVSMVANIFGAPVMVKVVEALTPPESFAP